MRAPPKLELRDLERRFVRTRAVSGLSLAVHKGEFLSLLGPSGCGKSTTLALIAGFQTPDAGEILIDGKTVNAVPPQRRRVGLVFQDYAVFSRLTVRDNLGFGLEARGVRRRERRGAVAEMAERLDLTPILDRRGASLNMSEMQRVALARVLITEPELLLLDEPMSNLDAHDRASLRTELKLIQRRLGQTVLYVTHDQVEAMSMSDRIAIMQNGRLQQLGTPDDIYHRPRNRFVAEFIGDPPINLIPCDVRRDGEQLTATTSRHRGMPLGVRSLPPGSYWLGVRPHDIRVEAASDQDASGITVRFVENFGAEHVLHVEYGEDLVRVVARRNAVRVGDRVRLEFNLGRAHLIDPGTEEVVGGARMEIAA